jgi:hypothetical protein
MDWGVTNTTVKGTVHNLLMRQNRNRLWIKATGTCPTDFFKGHHGGFRGAKLRSVSADSTHSQVSTTVPPVAGKGAGPAIAAAESAPAKALTLPRGGDRKQKKRSAIVNKDLRSKRIGNSYTLKVTHTESGKETIFHTLKVRHSPRSYPTHYRATLSCRVGH